MSSFAEGILSASGRLTCSYQIIISKQNLPRTHRVNVLTFITNLLKP